MHKWLSATLLLAAVTGISCKGYTQGITLKYNDPHIRYVGRIAMEDSAARMAWSGTSVSINFSGTGVKAVLGDEKGDTYYNVILDHKVVSILHPGAGKGT